MRTYWPHAFSTKAHHLLFENLTMKHTLHFCVTVAAVLSLTSPQAKAAPASVQAGLWQYNQNIKSQSGEFEKGMAKAQRNLASLPAEERKSIEKTMTDKGISLQANGSVLIKICINAEDAARGAIPIQKGNCTQKTVSNEGNITKVSFSCKAESPANGAGDITVLSPTSFKAQATADTTQMDGKPERLHITQEGKWLSADCAGIPSAYAP
jgi:hypothetical protein